MRKTGFFLILAALIILLIGAITLLFPRANAPGRPAVSLDAGDAAGAASPEANPAPGDSPPGETGQTPADGVSGIDPLGVPFPEGSVDHDFYPLIGTHAVIACENCHADNIYAGTPPDCASCHLPDKPEPHYEGDCAMCHAPTTWQEAAFDHALYPTSACAACHNP
jgi:hypothetical protein